MSEKQNFGVIFNRLTLCFAVIVGLVAASPTCQAEQPAPDSFFDTSLHATGEGMRYWYEEEGGFMKLTGIPYKDLGCKNCHATSCDKCHAEKEKDGGMKYSVEKSKAGETCLACHVRAQSAMGLDKKMGFTDVHVAKGLTCTDCHKGKDVHGDGTPHKSMRAADAVHTKCEDCHKKDQLSDADYHTVHEGKLHCNACHVTASMTCNNCHFDEFLRTMVKKGKAIPSKSWLLLVNYQDQVTAGNAQTLIGKGKTFVAYAPYFTHSVMKEGRKCNACHGSEHVKTMLEAKAVQITDFVDGKLVPAKGVIPLVPDKIKWTWLDMGENKPWTKMENPPEPVVQFAGYGKPLTQEQLEAMSEPME